MECGRKNVSELEQDVYHDKDSSARHININVNRDFHKILFIQ